MQWCKTDLATPHVSKDPLVDRDAIPVTAFCKDIGEGPRVSNRLEPHRENAKRSPSMPHTDISIPALLRERATMQGDATAYTFMDAPCSERAIPRR